MTWEYISGFFDADGSITVAKYQKNEQPTIQISFSNNEKNILEEIRDFIKKEININGSISKKLPKKETHSINYELKYVYKNAYCLSKYLNPLHDKKAYRIKIYEQIQQATPRNGKYTK